MILIEVCIGMVFLFLILSLMATAIQEIIATFLQLRGEKLSKAIKSIFEGEDKQLYKDFLDNPIYKQLCKPKEGKTDERKPSYIEAQTFAEIIVSMLATDTDGNVDVRKIALKNTLDTWKNENGGLQKTLALFLEESKGDIDAFKMKIEEWFNSIMNRVSGWYKRKIQYMLFFIGLGLAVGLNANAIYTFEYLVKNEKERSLIVEQAIEFAEDGENILKTFTDSTKYKNLRIEDKYDTLVSNLDSLFKSETRPLIANLNLGWSPSTCSRIYERFERTDWIGRIFIGLIMVLGWVISALAISLGAPFWFDNLVYLVNIRGAGKKLINQKKKDRSSTSN